MAPARHTMKITIDDWQYLKLSETASLSHKRLSSLVREIISEKLGATAELQKTDPIFGIVGMASGDGTVVAERHDDVIYGTGGIMQASRNYEKLAQKEIMAFPQERLPQLVQILRLLRQNFSDVAAKKVTKSSWELSLARLKGTVSGSEAFMARKAEEKALER